MKLKYSVKTRYGTTAEFTSKQKAIKAAKAEQKDGWPSWVRNLITGELIWK